MLLTSTAMITVPLVVPPFDVRNWPAGTASTRYRVVPDSAPTVTLAPSESQLALVLTAGSGSSDGDCAFSPDELKLLPCDSWTTQCRLPPAGIQPIAAEGLEYGWDRPRAR